MAEEIDFWTVEGSIYPTLDARSQRGETSWKNQKFELGGGQKLDMSVSSKNGSPVTLYQKFSSSEIDFKMNFRSGCDSWFRADNQRHDFLHFHLQSGAQLFEEKIPINKTCTVAQLISDTFEHVIKITKWKFPEFKISCGSDFVGTA